MTVKVNTERLSIIFDNPHGKDKLFISRLRGVEAISELFSFWLDLRSGETDLDLEPLVGANVTLHVRTPQGERCHINGILARIRACGMDGELARFEAELVPDLWRLGLRINSRIFQAKTALEIVQAILKESSIKHSAHVSANCAKRDYCVQYQETDLAFVSRLLEEEGISYLFKHSDGQHELILTDDTTRAKPSPGGHEYPVIHSTGSYWTEGHVESVEVERSLRSGTYAASDYNFETPRLDLLVKKAGSDDPEVFEYPGGYPVKGDGDKLARIRQEEMAWQRKTLSFRGHCQTLRSGHLMTLQEHPNLDGDYLLVRVQHDADQAAELTSAEADAGSRATFDTEFMGIPVDVKHRPLRLTPRPRIWGAQAAVVVGKAGEEIWTDKHGRVKVQFFWDREGKRDDKSSCWMRCVHTVAGGGWGQIFIPRMGQEVLVSFLDGDPDRPFVIGGMYNGVMEPPYDLPANQTRSTLKSRSSKKGGAANFNEIRFEDKKGQEEVFVQAEKNMKRLVKNDDVLEVLHDQGITVTNHRAVNVKEGNEKTKISKGNRTVELGQGNDLHLIKKGNRSVVLDLGNDSLTLKVGNQVVKLDVGQSTTQALKGIELKVMGNSIKIDPSGITIKGVMVKIEGQAMTDVKAGGPLTLKGAITMIG